MQPLQSARGRLIEAHPGIDKNFEILKKLGEGAFGSAYLAVDKASGHRRVLKAVRKHSDIPKEALDQEICVLKALDHPNIVRIFAHAEDYRFLYIILEPAEGGELLAVISDIHQEGKFQLNEAWASRVFQQCLSAMVYCHARGVLHKDLKGENIMLLGTECLEKPHAVIIDFGVAELISSCGSQRRGRLQAGTCTTMAPEVWRGNFGPKCDVWSIGCVLFQVLCGKFPFMARNVNDPSEWLRLHQQGPNWSRLCRVSDSARLLCQKLLVIDERIRPTADQCLRHRWFTQQASVSPSLDSGALQTLCELHAQSALERAVCMNIASSLNVAAISPLTEMFRACDRDGDGVVSPEDLSSTLRSAGLAADTVAQVIQLLQVQGQRHVEYTTFLSSLLATCSGVLDDSLWREFRRIDKDGSGQLSRNELREVLQGMHFADADAILSSVDTAGDGSISFDEFQKHFRRQTSTRWSVRVSEEAAANSTSVAPAPGAVATSVSVAPVTQSAASEPAVATTKFLTTSSTVATEVDILLSELEVCGVLESEDSESPAPSVPSNIAEALFQRADLDSDGNMSNFEFACWTAELLKAVRSDGHQVREVGDNLILDFNFSEYDRDKDNKLDRTEWQEMLNAIVEIVGISALRRLAGKAQCAGSQRSNGTQKEKSLERQGDDKPRPQENEVDALLLELGL